MCVTCGCSGDSHVTIANSQTGKTQLVETEINKPHTLGETHLIAEIPTRIRFEPDQKSVMSLVITLERSPAQ